MAKSTTCCRANHEGCRFNHSPASPTESNWNVPAPSTVLEHQDGAQYIESSVRLKFYEGIRSEPASHLRTVPFRVRARTSSKGDQRASCAVLW